MATAPESLTGYDFLAAGGIHFGFSLTMPTAVVVKGDGVGGVTPNRHKRHGLLFQNRYKSVICQEDLYFTELVRYIHLNPLGAGLVANMTELHRYPYSGHSALLGKTHRPWQATADVLVAFGRTVPGARKAYVAYVEAGIGQGRCPDLTGGGLVRSLGGWAAVVGRRETGEARLKSDERILGASEFVEAILARAEERVTRHIAWKRRGIGFPQVLQRVAELFQITSQDVLAPGRQRHKVRPRSVLCFWAVRELGLSLTEIARHLGMSPPGVSYAVERGEAIVRANGYTLG